MKKGTYVSLGLRNAIEAAVKEGHKVLLYIQAARGVSGIQDEVKKTCPAARVKGYDKSSTALPPEFDVLVATQAIFRHRSALKVGIAAVLDIDWEFHKNHHQASHGAFALVQHLRQMAGQYVLLQTRQASDPLLHTLASNDAGDFYCRELALRREMGLPPFQALVTVIIRSADPLLACSEAKRLYDMLKSGLDGNMMIFEAQEDRTAVMRGKFRYCVCLHGPPGGGSVTALAVKKGLKDFRPKKDAVVTVNVDE